MTTVIKNATIVTGNPEDMIIYGGGIAIDVDKIATVGSTPEVLAAYPDSEQVDGAGRAVFPGLVNCHTHLLATADRGILEDFGFPTTLGFPTTTRSMLTQEERQVMAVLGALEAIRSGATCLLEISTGVQDYAQSLEQTGLRLVLADNINDADEAKARGRPVRVLAGPAGPGTPTLCRFNRYLAR